MIGVLLYSMIFLIIAILVLIVFSLAYVSGEAENTETELFEKMIEERRKK